MAAVTRGGPSGLVRASEFVETYSEVRFRRERGLDTDVRLFEFPVEAPHTFAPPLAEAGNLLYPLIRSLRRRLGYPAGEMGCIESVRGVGYRLVAPVQEA